MNKVLLAGLAAILIGNMSMSAVAHPARPSAADLKQWEEQRAARQEAGGIF